MSAEAVKKLIKSVLVLPHFFSHFGIGVRLNILTYIKMSNDANYIYLNLAFTL